MIKKINTKLNFRCISSRVLSIIIDTMSLDVGTHLKAVRQMYGLSQRELAKRAGVTNGLISLIEQNRVSPSVSSLKKVLDGIPMALADFFTLDLGGQPQVFFPRQELSDIGTASVELRLVGSRLAKRSMSILHERYAPNADTGEEMLTHAGEEGGVVVKGKIELTVGGESRVLGPGRCLLFQELPAASLPQHRARGMRDRQRQLAPTF